MPIGIGIGISVGALTPTRAGVVAPFSPADISGLQLWLDATNGLFDATSGGNPVTTDGSAVARWEDQSGNGNHATQSDSGFRPLLKTSIQNSKNILRFDGSNDRMTIGDRLDLGANDLSMFVVCKISSGIDAGICGKARAGSAEKRYFLLREANNLYFLCQTQTGATNQSTYPTQADNSNSNFRIITSSYKRGDGKYLRINKTQIQKITSSNDGGSWDTDWQFLIGAFPDASGGQSSIYAMNGDIAEILVYIGTSIADSDRDKIETYLYDKWAIS